MDTATGSILEKAKGKDADGSSDDDYGKAKEDAGKRMATAIKEDDGGFATAAERPSPGVVHGLG